VHHHDRAVDPFATGDPYRQEGDERSRAARLLVVRMDDAGATDPVEGLRRSRGQAGLEAHDCCTRDAGFAAAQQAIGRGVADDAGGGGSAGCDRYAPARVGAAWYHGAGQRVRAVMMSCHVVVPVIVDAM
jgi:hypothetical protein